MTPKAQVTKAKNRQMGSHQTKKLLHRKGDKQWSKEIVYGMEENIFKS
jgi:hypothetical protein